MAPFKQDRRISYETVVGDFSLRSDDLDVARADITSLLTRRSISMYGIGELILTAVQPFTPSFQLMDGNRVIETIKPNHLFTRGDAPLRFQTR